MKNVCSCTMACRNCRWESLADLPGVCIKRRQNRAVEVDAFKDIGLAGKAVLVHTGWSRHWLRRSTLKIHHSDFKGCKFLVESRVCLVGIDSMNIDDIHEQDQAASYVAAEG